MRVITCGILLLSAIHVFSQSPWSRSMLHLPDTGQNQDFTSTPGEDADISLFPLSYVVHGDGTVTDEVTGLMWQALDGGEMTFEASLSYCDTLQLGGHSDWRLPSAHELMSIQNLQSSNPSIDLTAFESTDAEYWWSSDTQVNDANKVWVTNAGGGIGNHPKTETVSAGGSHRFHVRAVRQTSPAIQISTRFISNGDGTITDAMTDLMWQAVSLDDTLSWEEALHFADTMEMAGFSDWRLPDIKELHSINQEDILNPSIDSGWSGVGEARKWWSSTTLLNDPSKAWYLYSRFGITTYDYKENAHYVRLVRSGEITSSMIQVAEKGLFFYPNPVTDFLNASKEDAGQYSLLDSHGKCLMYLSGMGPWNLSDLTPGIYFLMSECSPIKFQLIKK